jgi:hypothetical protein
MPFVKKLLRDIDELRESIQIDWEELYANPLRDRERRDLHKHIKLCQSELKVLLEKLSKLDEESSD